MDTILTRRSLLKGLLVTALTAGVSPMMVPEGVLAFTCTTSVIGALAAADRLASVQVNDPV